MRSHFRFWLRQHYQGDESALQKAWNDPEVTLDTAEVPSHAEQFQTRHLTFRDPRQEGKVIDYYRCLADLCGGLVIDFCRTVKEATAGRALAGAFYGHYVTIISPNMMVLSQMGLVMAMAIIGGVENLIAAAIGGILIQVGLELLREFGSWRLVIFGALLMIILRFARNGLLAPVFRSLFGMGSRAELREEATADGA